MINRKVKEDTSKRIKRGGLFWIKTKCKNNHFGLIQVAIKKTKSIKQETRENVTGYI